MAEKIEDMLSKKLEQTLQTAFQVARQKRHEFLTVEHLLLALFDDKTVVEVLRACGANLDVLRKDLSNFLEETTPKFSKRGEQDTQPTIGLQRVLQRAHHQVQSSGKKEITGMDVLVALFSEGESQAVYFLDQQDITRLDVVSHISHGISEVDNNNTEADTTKSMPDDILKCYEIDQPLTEWETKFVESNQKLLKMLDLTFKKDQVGKYYLDQPLTEWEKAFVKQNKTELKNFNLTFTQRDGEYYLVSASFEYPPEGYISSGEDYLGSASFKYLPLEKDYFYLFPGSLEYSPFLEEEMAMKAYQQGDYSTATGVFELVLRLNMLELGERDQGTLSSINNIANCLRKQGHIQKALSLHQLAYERRLSLLGPQHYETLSSLNNLTNCWEDMGCTPEELLPRRWKVYESLKSVRGMKAQETLSSFNCLAVCLEALSLSHQSFHGNHKSVYHGQHPDTRWKIIPTDDALKFYKIDQSLTKWERVVVTRNQTKLKTLGLAFEQRNNEYYLILEFSEYSRFFKEAREYAYYYYQQKDYWPAIGVFKLMLKVSLSILGDYHPDTLSILNNLAACLQQVGYVEEALSLHLLAYKDEEDLEKVVKILNNIVLCLQELECTQEYMQWRWLVYEGYKSIRGDQAPDTLTSLNDLALCMQKLGNAEEALQLHQQAYEGCKSVLGRQDPTTIKSLNNLALCLQKLERIQEALPLFQLAYEGCMYVLSGHYESTLWLLNNTRDRLGRVELQKKLMKVLEVLYSLVPKIIVHQDLWGTTQKPVLNGNMKFLSDLRKIASFLAASPIECEKWTELTTKIATILATSPMRYGKWTELTVKITIEIAEWCNQDRAENDNADWVNLFRSLSHAFAYVLDGQPEIFLREARKHFNIFHTIYLRMCLMHKRENIVPEVLYAVQGRKIAALIFDEFTLSSVTGKETKYKNLLEERAELRQQKLAPNGDSFQQRLENYQITSDEHQVLHEQMRAFGYKGNSPVPPFRHFLLSLDTLQSKLRNEEALLLLMDFTEVDEQKTRRGFALVITRNAYSPFHLTGLPQLSELTQQYENWRGTSFGLRLTLSHKGTGEKSTEQKKITLQTLQEKMEEFLWHPLSESIKGIRHLHIVTHGELHVLSYELGAPKGLTFNTYPGLVFYNMLRHRPEQVQQAHQPTCPNIEAPLGIHVYDAKDHPDETYVPSVNAEAEMVKAIWGKNAAKSVNVEKGEPIVNFLYLSGHGGQDPDDPADASLLIGQNKFLRLQDILRSPLRPRVVFLSSCVVGRTSEDIDGDPLGLVSAFFMRGAEYVIASLIPLPPFYMPVLVVLFHQAWQRGQSPDAALTEAKRRFKQGYWYEDTESIVRDNYRPILAEYFREIAKKKDRSTWEAFQKSWPVPKNYDFTSKGDIDDFLEDELSNEEDRNNILKELLDNLCNPKTNLDVNNFSTWVRGFGYTGR